MKILFKYLFFIVLIGTVSCGKWLDVKPDEEIDIDDALQDRIGFTQALAGIYSGMTSPTLYGRNLEYGMLDIMAGYWKVSTANNLYDIYKFDYQLPKSQDTIASIWSGLYRSIRQCNFILNKIENINKYPDYKLIKGEALGLRAYLHLEAFKLFGPVVKIKGLNTEALPYYKEISKIPQKFLTSEVFLAEVENDLKEAEINLLTDPIQSIGRENNGNTGSVLNYNSLLDRRGVRMNYYAVLALLARTSLWRGNLPEASLRAQDLITKLNASQAIRFMQSNELDNAIINKDIRFTKENIFALYVNDIVQLTRVHFDSEFKTNAFALDPDYSPFLKGIYEQGSGSTLDYRLNLWNISTPYFGKYVIPKIVLNTKDIEKDHFYEVQLINLSELYFILAENLLDSDLQESLSYLNKVREARKLPPLAYTNNLTRNEVFQYLIDEVRREYIGEGFLFTFFKRLYHSIYRSSGEIAPSEEIFTLPIPIDERIYNTAN